MSYAGLSKYTGTTYNNRFTVKYDSCNNIGIFIKIKDKLDNDEYIMLITHAENSPTYTNDRIERYINDTVIFKRDSILSNVLNKYNSTSIGSSGMIGISGLTGTSGDVGISTYAGYITENINKNVDYYSEYITENINKNISYAEYIAIQAKENISYAEYIVGQAKENISYAEYIASRAKENINKMY